MRLKAELLEFASRDTRLSGAAVTGSAAEGKEDRWSDIDLAFGVADASAVNQVLADFSNFMYRRGALHQYDLKAGAWLYRVFFLPGALQVDLAFVERNEFRPLGPAFQLIFGESKSLQAFPSPSPIDVIGLAWLHALHARSSILRGKLWQAEYMISGTRNHVLELACRRLDLPTAHGRGLHLLPESVTGPLAASLVRSIHAEELRRAFAVVVESLCQEIHRADPALGARISDEIRNLAIQI